METYDAFVRGLTADTDKKDFEDLFKANGKVQGINFKTLSSGTQAAFVRFVHKDSLDSAIKNLNGYMFQGAMLTVSVGSKTRKKTQVEGSPLSKSPRGARKSEEKETERMFQVGERVEVVVTHIESAVEFWGQLADDEKNQELAKLIESLNAYCATGGEEVRETSGSEVYGALFTADNVWYRTSVIEKPTRDEALIRYIDYGNTEMVATCSLVHLPKKYKSPPYAYKFRLSGLTLPRDESMLHQGEEYLTSVILDKYLSVTIKDVSLGGACEVELGGVAMSDSDDMLNIAKKLVECGYAVTRIGNGKLSSSRKVLNFNLGPEEATNHVSFAEFESLKKENAKLKEQLETEQKEHQTALLEAIGQGMQIQISNLIDKVESLKELRSQMPLASSSPKILEEAIQLVLDEDARVELSTLAEVEEVKNAREQFQKVQREILNSKDKASIEALVSDRDKHRIELSDAINAFLVCAQQKLSVQTREAYLKYIYDKLLKLIPDEEEEELGIHGDYDATQVSDAVESYKQFMERVTLQRKATQKNSDEACQAIVTAMQTLCQVLSLDCTEENKSADSAFDMTQLFQDYTSAVDKEAEELNGVSKMNILECREVNYVLHSVLMVIEKELRDIDALRESMRRHSQLQSEVDQWLVNRPDVTPLKTCRKTSRKLRIEFGHKMVEQRELIDDEDAEELQVVTDELNTIQAKLQMAFAQETEEMQRIASMVEQFPELLTLYPEFNLQSFALSGGLLLSGRSIEHFERKEHLLYTDQPAFRSTFNNTPCVIKEFHLPSEDTIEVIIRNAQLLNKVQNPGIVRVLSTFKEANKVFVQLSNYGTVNLVDMTCSELDYLSIFSQVLQTLSLLHEKGIAYGDLRPSSIWVTPSENDLPLQVTLSDFSLDKSESARIKSSLVPVSKCEGIRSVSSDMYCFGKLILWSIQPAATLTHYPDGNPRLAKFSLSDSLRSLLEGILHADPKMRFSATTALNQPYFSPAIPITPSPAAPVTPPESVIDENELPALDVAEEEEGKEKKNTSCSSDVLLPGESDVDTVPMPLLEYPTTD